MSENAQSSNTNQTVESALDNALDRLIDGMGQTQQARYIQQGIRAAAVLLLATDCLTPEGVVLAYALGEANPIDVALAVLSVDSEAANAKVQAALEQVCGTGGDADGRAAQVAALLASRVEAATNGSYGLAQRGDDAAGS